MSKQSPLLIVVVLALLVGCRHPLKPSPAPAVARGEGLVISAGALRDYVSRFARSPVLLAQLSSPERRKEMLDAAIETELLAREARRLGFDNDWTVKRQMMTRFLEEELDAKVKPTDVPDADVEAYFRSHPSEFSRPEKVRAAQIFCRDRSKAQRAANEATKLSTTDSGGFRNLVAQYSEDEASRSRGGELPAFDRETSAQPRTVVDAAFALKETGEVSGVLPVENGFVVLQLVDKLPRVSRTLTEAKEEIQSRLVFDLRKRKKDALISSLRDTSKVRIDEAQLAGLNFDGIGHSDRRPEFRTKKPGEERLAPSAQSGMGRPALPMLPVEPPRRPIQPSAGR